MQLCACSFAHAACARSMCLHCCRGSAAAVLGKFHVSSPWQRQFRNRALEEAFSQICSPKCEQEGFPFDETDALQAGIRSIDVGCEKSGSQSSITMSLPAQPVWHREARMTMPERIVALAPGRLQQRAIQSRRTAARFILGHGIREDWVWRAALYVLDPIRGRLNTRLAVKRGDHEQTVLNRPHLPWDLIVRPLVAPRNGCKDLVEVKTGLQACRTEGSRQSNSTRLTQKRHKES